MSPSSTDPLEYKTIVYIKVQDFSYIDNFIKFFSLFTGSWEPVEYHILLVFEGFQVFAH